MATLSAIISRVSAQLNDTAKVRWTETELLAWLNEAIKQIVILLPESNAVTVEVKLAEGTRQAVPADGVRLIDVIRNTGPDGGKPSGPIRIIERDILDTLRPSWHGDRAASRATNYIFDTRNPKVYYVYPPSRGQFIELVYSQLPAAKNLNDELDRFEVYSAAIINYVLHRAFAKDTEAGSEARSREYERSFLQSIGLFDQADMKVLPPYHTAPKNKSTGESY